MVLYGLKSVQLGYNKLKYSFTGQYYVPLIRSLDNSTQPVIGQPWSPDISKSPADSSGIPTSQMSPRDPLLSIKACAGPMSPSFVSTIIRNKTLILFVELMAITFFMQVLL